MMKGQEQERVHVMQHISSYI